MSRYLVFGAVSLSLLLVSISGSAIAVAFPLIISSFDTSLILAGWVLSINQLVATAVMPLAGKAGDIFGGKLTFMVSILIFTIGSLLCALAPNIELLIGARLIQAIGAGSFLPLATAIVSDQFPESRQRAIGLFSSIFPIGMIIGPNLGGWLVEAFGWRSVFWFNIPLCVITFVASAFLLRATKREGGHMDLVGAGLFTGSLSAFLVAFSEIGNSQGKSSWFLPGLLFAAAIVFMFFFIRHEGRNKNPIIDLQLLKQRPFLAANIFNLLYGMSVLGIMSFIPFYATSVYGMSTLESGLILTPRSVGMIAASTITSIFLTRWGYRLPMLIGTGAVVLSLVLLGIASPVMNALGIQTSATALLVVFMLLSGIGMGMTAPAANNACIELMPRRVATITGVRGMFRQAGGAISIAVTSFLLHFTVDISHGFTVVFLGLALILVLTTPLVFAMPRAPGAPATEESGKQGA
ncbi:MAG TPA: MFS transporter [Dehalococcoidales bacterium]|nr:MFS transporter [Dehalococcoidales bacterium]